MFNDDAILRDKVIAMQQLKQVLNTYRSRYVVWIVLGLYMAVYYFIFVDAGGLCLFDGCDINTRNIYVDIRPFAKHYRFEPLPQYAFDNKSLYNSRAYYAKTYVDSVDKTLWIDMASEQGVAMLESLLDKNFMPEVNQLVLEWKDDDFSNYSLLYGVITSGRIDTLTINSSFDEHLLLVLGSLLKLTPHLSSFAISNKFNTLHLFEFEYNDYISKYCCYISTSDPTLDLSFLLRGNEVLKECILIIDERTNSRRPDWNFNNQVESMVLKLYEETAISTIYINSTSSDLYPHINHWNHTFLRRFYADNGYAHVVPMFYDGGRLNYACLFCFIMTLPVSVLIVQLSGQFQTVSSRLLPDFRFYHLGFAGGAWLVLCSPCFYMLRKCGFEWDAIGVIAFIPMVTLAVDTRFRRFFAAGFPLYTQPLSLLFSLFAGVGSIIAIVLYVCPYHVYGLLRGMYPMATIAVLLVELWLVRYLICELCNLHHNSLLHHHGLVPLSITDVRISSRDRSISPQNNSMQNHPTWQWLQHKVGWLTEGLQNRELVRVLDSQQVQRQPTPQQLWNAGYEYAYPRLLFMGLVGGFFVIYCAGMCLLYDFIFSAKLLQGFFSSIVQYNHYLFFVVVMVCLMVIVLNLLNRRPMLIWESIHPWDKAQQYVWMLNYIRRELIIPQILVSVLLLLQMGTDYWMSWPLGLLLFFVARQFLAPLMIVLFTLRHAVTLLLAGIPAVILMTLTTIFFLEQKGVEQVWLSFAGIPGQLSCIVLLSIAAYVTRKISLSRWKNLEVARLYRM
jgi:hypothetical protein